MPGVTHVESRLKQARGQRRGEASRPPTRTIPLPPEGVRTSSAVRLPIPREAIVPTGWIARLLEVESNHPAVLREAIAFVTERSSGVGAPGSSSSGECSGHLDPPDRSLDGRNPTVSKHAVRLLTTRRGLTETAAGGRSRRRAPLSTLPGGRLMLVLTSGSGGVRCSFSINWEAKTGTETETEGGL